MKLSLIYSVMNEFILEGDFYLAILMGKPVSLDQIGSVVERERAAGLSACCFCLLRLLSLSPALSLGTITERC